MYFKIWNMSDTNMSEYTTYRQVFNEPQKHYIIMKTKHKSVHQQNMYNDCKNTPL